MKDLIAFSCGEKNRKAAQTDLGTRRIFWFCNAPFRMLLLVPVTRATPVIYGLVDRATSFSTIRAVLEPTSIRITAPNVDTAALLVGTLQVFYFRIVGVFTLPICKIKE